MLRTNSHESNANNSVTESFTNISHGGEESDLMPWDNSDPFVTAHTRNVIVKLSNCYIRQFIIFLGIPGNALSCVVFMKQRLSDRINLLLFCLGIADFFNLLTHLLLVCNCYFVDRVRIANWTTLANAKFTYVSFYWNFVMGVLIALVSFDRCLSVVTPFKARTLFTYRATATAIFVSYLVPLTVYLPGCLVFTVRWKTDPSTNRSIAYMDTSSWFHADARLVVDTISSFAVVAKPVFLIIMVSCCTVTIVKLRQATLQRFHMTGKENETHGTGDNRITKMLLFLSVIYIVLVFPEICAGISVAVFPEYYLYEKYHNTLVVTYQFVWVASCLNSAVNFFAYLVLSSRFRKSLIELFSCCKQNMHTP